MNLQAIFPVGATTLTVNGLHQWDYGRKLEIHADDLPAMVEVHFACPGMPEAVVRSCEAVDGVAVAVIPDQCLEQSAPVVAWVYEIDGTTGMTTKTVTLPVIARARPQPGATVPTEISDKYTEAITAMNEAVANFNAQDVKVGEAAHADEAEYAAEAGKANTANSASFADEAEYLARILGDNSATGIVSIDMTSRGSGLYYVEVKSVQDQLDTGALIFYKAGHKSCAALLTYPTGLVSGGEYFIAINAGGETTNKLEVFHTKTTVNSNGYLVNETSKNFRAQLTIKRIIGPEEG